MPTRLAVLAAVVAVACATVRPDRSKYLADAAVKYPTAEYIVGYGVGATPEEAEERARIDAAGTIRSELSSNVRIVQTSTNTGAGEQQTQAITDELLKRVETDAGAFISPVRELTRETGRQFEAIAIANRAELDQKYEAEAAPKASKLEALWDRALADPTSKAAPAALCEGDILEKDLDRMDLERRLVSRRTVWSESLLAKRKSVTQLRQQLKGGVEVNVVRDAAATIDPALWDFIVQELGAAGYSARVVDAADCAAKKDSLTVKVAMEQSCGNAPIGGVRCDVTLATVGSRCDETSALFAINSNRASALHATNTALALQAAIRKLDLKQYTRGVAGRVLNALGEGCRK